MGGSPPTDIRVLRPADIRWFTASRHFGGLPPTQSQISSGLRLRCRQQSAEVAKDAGSARSRSAAAALLAAAVLTSRRRCPAAAHLPARRMGGPRRGRPCPPVRRPCASARPPVAMRCGWTPPSSSRPPTARSPISSPGPQAGPLTGMFDPGRRTWTSSALAGGTVYAVDAVATGADGRRATAAAFLRTLTPARALTYAVNPEDGELVGVGTPITVHFDVPVTDRASVQRRLRVTNDHVGADGPGRPGRRRLALVHGQRRPVPPAHALAGEQHRHRRHGLRRRRRGGGHLGRAVAHRPVQGR